MHKVCSLNSHNLLIIGTYDICT